MPGPRWLRRSRSDRLETPAAKAPTRPLLVEPVEATATSAGTRPPAPDSARRHPLSVHSHLAGIPCPHRVSGPARVSVASAGIDPCQRSRTTRTGCRVRSPACAQPWPRWPGCRCGRWTPPRPPTRLPRCRPRGPAGRARSQAPVSYRPHRRRRTLRCDLDRQLARPPHPDHSTSRAPGHPALEEPRGPWPDPHRPRYGPGPRRAGRGHPPRLGRPPSDIDPHLPEQAERHRRRPDAAGDPDGRTQGRPPRHRRTHLPQAAARSKAATGHPARHTCTTASAGQTAATPSATTSS